MNLTDKQKKYAWIAVGVLIFAHFFLPGIVNTVRHAFAHNAPAVLPKPSPAIPALVPPPPPSPEAVAASKYGGVWEGDTLMPDSNRCAVKLEIRLSDDSPKKLKGYSSVRCMPLQTLARGVKSLGAAKEMVRDYSSPASAIMTGTPQSAGISFAVDSTVSASSDGCSITGFSIEDFGQGQVMARWQEGTCAPRQMLLKKGRG